MNKKVVSVIAAISALCALLSACAKENATSDFYGYSLSTYVKLGNYKDVDYDMENAVVENADVEERIKAELRKYGFSAQTEEDKAISLGNVAVIDFSAFIDNKPVSKMSDTDFSLSIGSGEFIEGFESGLIGKKAGDNVSLKLKFPKTYPNSDYAGKKVRFEVKIKKVLVEVFPTLTDEMVSKISTAKTVSDYHTYIYDKLMEEKKQEVAENNRNSMIEAIVKSSTVKKYPKIELEYYEKSLREHYTQVAQKSNLSLEQYIEQIGQTKKEFDKFIEESAKKLVVKDIVFLQIAREEGINLSNDYYEDKLQSYMNENRYKTKEELFADVGEATLKGQFLIEKTIDEMASIIHNH